ncbi:guanine deaminase [Martelella radicis]|uniref:Guanine deaminase n=1 Tax=Martelella radicis TaxID=1397476 RepID=A0A7W6KK02_9HYPH|nr:guanine deaminase [Martelella radicis]MBB4121313.1 guanine deaminase [Martelella radicis]
MTPPRILRGRLLSFNRRPLSISDTESYVYEDDGGLLISGGRILAFGPFETILLDAPEGAEIVDHRPNLILPGLIDTHLHFPQMQVVGSYAANLLEWLNTYTFVEEQRFADPAHGARIAVSFFDEMIRQGTTTAVAYCSVHKASADAYFAEASKRNMLMLGGKVLMDCNAPEVLTDTPQSAYDDTKAVIADWHGKARNHVVISPRFALTSSHEQMEVTGALAREFPDLHIQTHLSENTAEIERALELYPEAQDYTDIYARYDLLGAKTLLGHAIHLSERERDVLNETGAVAVHCPTSNLFLGSGLFPFKDYETREKPVRIAVATDIGGGTSYSMLKTMDEAYKIQQLRGERLNPLESFFAMTLGNAEALSLADRIGTLDPDSDADLVVLDARATPAMALKMDAVSTLAEELFLLQTMGDDRAIAETYVAGNPVKSGL